jgi:hypothetical protein
LQNTDLQTRIDELMTELNLLKTANEPKAEEENLAKEEISVKEGESSN